MVRKLLRMGADPNTQDNAGYTLIYFWGEFWNNFPMPRMVSTA